MRALQQKDFAAAVSAANAGLKTNPKDCRLLTIRGIAQQNLAQPQDALQSFQHAVSYCPKFLPALEGVAQIEYAQHSPKAAEAVEAILAVRPDDTTAHAMLGVLNWQKGRCEEAVEHFSKAGPQVDASTAAQAEYGSCLLDLDRMQDAEAIFKKMMEADGSEISRRRYAFAAWKNKDYANALDALTPLLSPSSTDSAALRLAAQIAEDKGDTPHAVAWLRQAIVADPKNVENYLIFAGISFAHNSFQVGIDMLNTGLQQDPQEARFYLARGVLRVQLSQFQEAVGDFQKAHQLDPQLSLAEDAMGMMHSQQHQDAAALATFRDLAAKQPNDALLQYLYAEALSQQEENASPQNLTDATRAAEKAVQLEPNYEPARDLLSVLYLRANMPQQVIEQAEYVLKLNPLDETALYQMMMAYRKLGNKEKVDALVIRLREAKSRNQNSKQRYLLQDANTSANAPQP